MALFFFEGKVRFGSANALQYLRTDPHISFTVKNELAEWNESDPKERQNEGI